MHSQHAHGVCQGPGQGVEQGEGADGDPPGDEEPAPHQQHRDGQRLGQAVDVGAVLQPQQGGLGVGGLVVLVLPVELLHLVVLPGEGLHHPVAGDVLLRAGVQLGQPLPQVHVQGMDLPGEEEGEQEDHRGHRQHGQGEDPVRGKEHDGRGEEQHGAVDELPDDPAHRVAHHVHVAGEAGHEVAGAVPAEEGLVLLLHVLVQVPPELVDELLGTGLVSHDGQVLETGAEQGKANEHRHQENQVLHHLLRHHPRVGEGLEHRVHDVGGDHRVAQGQNGEHRRGTQGEHVPLPVALQLFPHPFELKHRTPPPLPYFFALAQKSVPDKAFPIIATAPKKGRGFCGKVPRQSAEFSPFSPALLCQVHTPCPHSKRRARPAPREGAFPGPACAGFLYRFTSSAAARSQASSSPSSSWGVPTTTWWVHRPGRGSTRPEILGWSRGSRRPKVTVR